MAKMQQRAAWFRDLIDPGGPLDMRHRFVTAACIAAGIATQAFPATADEYQGSARVRAVDLLNGSDRAFGPSPGVRAAARARSL